MNGYGLTVLLYADAPKKLLRTMKSLLRQSAGADGARLRVVVLDAADGEAKAVVDTALKQPHPAVDVQYETAQGADAAAAYRAYLPQVETEAVCLSSCRVYYIGSLLNEAAAMLEREPSLQAVALREMQAEGRWEPLYCFETAAHGSVPERYICRTAALREAEMSPTTLWEKTPAEQRLELTGCSCALVRECLFSIVLYADDEERLDAALDNLLVQEDLSRYGTFCDNHTVQILVMDPHCDEITEAVCAKYTARYPYVKRIPAEDKVDCEAYNLALPLIRGVYTAFTAASASYTADALSQIEDVFASYPVSLVALYACYDTEFGTQKGYAAMPGGMSRVISLALNPAQIHLHGNAYFIETALLKDRTLDESLGSDALLKLILELLSETDGVYYFLKNQQYLYSVPREDNTSTFMQQHEPSWYTEAVNTFLLPLLTQWEQDGVPAPEFLQIAVMYLLFARYNCNLNERTKGALDAEEREAFFAASGELLTHIEEEQITQKALSPVNFPRTLMTFFLRLRAQALKSELEVCEQNGRYYYRIGTAPWVRMTAVTNEQLLISAINYEPGYLMIDARLSLPDFLQKEDCELKVYRNGRPVSVTPTHTYALISCFGQVISDRYVYRIAVPTEPAADGTVTFVLATSAGEIPLRLVYQTAHSRLSNLPGSYWVYRPGRVVLTDERSLHLRTLKKGQRRRYERAFLLENFRQGRKKAYVLKCLLLRLVYWMTRPFFRRRHIWVTFDKLYKAGDNGEYMYRYIAAQHDDVTPYYIIKPDSLDYPRLKKDRVRLLKFYTLKCLLTCLNAEVILTTHANVISYCGFQKKIYPYFRDLFGAEVVCIQHGLTTQSIAQFQNRLFDNLKLYCCASPNEIRNLTQPAYGFAPEQLKLTGLARYDGLKNRDRKNILITPTWRRNIVNSNVAHMQKKHSEFFRSSEYFRLYDRLIHDEELIRCAKECGYSITYLLHPGMSAQIDDFDSTGYVDVVAAYSDVNYEKILTEASLMVTDYSGVQFDFAYMRKPLLYYHPNTLPPHYEESDAFRCERDGFGPIIDHHEELVRQLCAYMRDGCRMKPEYVARADAFFAFSDHESCRRIYAAVREYRDTVQNRQ